MQSEPVKSVPAQCQVQASPDGAAPSPLPHRRPERFLPDPPQTVGHRQARAGLAHTAGLVLPRDDVHLYVWHLRKGEDRIVFKARLHHATKFDCDFARAAGWLDVLAAVAAFFLARSPRSFSRMMELGRSARTMLMAAAPARGTRSSPKARPIPQHADGSPPCFLSDISGWSLSLGGAARRADLHRIDPLAPPAGSTSWPPSPRSF